MIGKPALILYVGFLLNKTLEILLDFSQFKSAAHFEVKVNARGTYKDFQ